MSHRSHRWDQLIKRWAEVAFVRDYRVLNPGCLGGESRYRRSRRQARWTRVVFLWPGLVFRIKGSMGAAACTQSAAQAETWLQHNLFRAEDHLEIDTLDALRRVGHPAAEAPFDEEAFLFCLRIRHIGEGAKRAELVSELSWSRNDSFAARAIRLFGELEADDSELIRTTLLGLLSRKPGGRETYLAAIEVLAAHQDDTVREKLRRIARNDDLLVDEIVEAATRALETSTCEAT